MYSFNPVGCVCCPYCNSSDIKPLGVGVTKTVVNCIHPLAPKNEEVDRTTRLSQRPIWCPMLKDLRVTCQTIY